MARLLALLVLATAAALAAGSPIQVPSSTVDGFAVPRPGVPLAFPRDHGSHPDHRIEWWYLTGHLEDADGTAFGVQATFFRQARPDLPARLAAPMPASADASFGDEHLLLAHMALVDPAGRRFLHQERLARPGFDAWAREGTLDVRHGPWSLRLVEPGPGEPDEVMELEGGIRADATFRLRLVPAKPRVVFGEDFVSRKGAEPTAVSSYVTFSRLAASGTLVLDGRERAVTGLLWMDHEFSSNQLAPDQVGWDWASIQLDDGRELMVYVLRKADGTPDPWSSLNWVLEDATVVAHRPPAFRWTATGHWTSPETGGRYPVRSRLEVPTPGGGPPTVFLIEPVLDAQELLGELAGIAYWEGACRVLDAEGKPVGRAYVELTGYATSLADRL